ncbi:NTPase KAP family P-loop domain-containing protein [Skeletonema marinoi]|uniref:NTPase KAP family P-loop domain-containing protein n=1 Tax=Skeletonema marinoi TaxID=267567 RepID=A0AAD8YAY1_9STRA|nr:NTPase KAP family P-loop domain-containing protein [Skeletonema marinoi]
MKDLQPPFVVGILGGWGSGKSFTFNLIREYLKKIQKYDLASEAVKLNSPYVGHIYPIEFSAWTFAKDDLWASIMHHGNITKAFIDATNSNYEKEVKELEEKKEKLLKVTVKKKHHLAWEEVTSDFNSTFLPEIKKLLKNAYDQYAKGNPLDPVPQTVDAAMNSMEQYKGMFGRFKIYWGLLRAGNISPLWLTVFLSSLVIAVVLPLVIHNTGLIATAIGPLVSGIYTVYNNAREKLSSAEVEIAKVASKMRLDKEQVRKALEAADRAQLRSDTNDEERQQDIMRGLNAEINALEDRVWLREGDSLKKVVVERLGSSNYEERLGVVHQAQADLRHISDAMLRRDGNEEDAAKKIFPRGDPRIVLFIDDLDRCPPEKVVETLEAVQLLVNTDLFVVVLAIDAKYVTLCLEKNYVDILHPERHPSGLDYIEKIIQLPYRVPPISAEYMKSYLQEQMNAKKTFTHKSSDSEELSDEFNRARPNVDISAPLLSENASDEATSCAETPMMETAQSKPQEPSLGAEESKRDDDIQSPSDNAYPSDRETPMTETAQFEPDAVPLPTEELDFTWEELELVEDVCVFSGVIPRSAKRLVNVFKLMKIIWHRREQTPDEDTPHEVSMKDACVLILALCASKSRSVRREMCKVLVKIETATSRPADCGNLKSFIKTHSHSRNRVGAGG